MKRTTWIAAGVAWWLLGGVLLLACAFSQPPSLDRMEGDCPAVGARLADPLDVCADQGVIAHQHAVADAAALLALEARHGCLPAAGWPAGQVPAGAIQSSATGPVWRPLGVAVAASQHGIAWTLALCEK